MVFTNKQDFLLELGCEEIPARAQQNLSCALHDQFSQILSENKLTFSDIKCFSTPRRLAILITGLDTTQAPQTIERQGPSLQEAYDKSGIPTLVCLGFAKSCGVSVDQLTIKETPKGKRLACVCEKPGLQTKTLLPEIVSTVISTLPIAKPMRWGKNTATFIRPVQWIVMLFGEEVISATIFGIQTSRDTIGHRFHHPKPIRITKPSDYAMLLYSQGFVIADFESRKNTIKKAILSSVNSDQQVVLDEDLLNEVTALVEWPIILKGKFDKPFLSIPKEVLITSMKTHQRCFPVTDLSGNLQPLFVIVCNIVSKNSEMVVKGNERVICARLSDAAFFYQQDCKQTLINRLPKLEHTIFQDQLGSLGDKTQRLIKLASVIAKKMNSEINEMKRAATLCKCDLVTDMVGEFPNLQGVMGCYYALNDHESEVVAEAIREHYLPKFSGDVLPASEIGSGLALADRIDTVIGVLGIGKTPTGDKDPFALRRAAHGIVRILIEKKIEVDLSVLLTESKKLYTTALTNHAVVKEAHEFILTRLKSWYIEQGVSVEVFESVSVCQPASLIDFDHRVKAVLQFQKLPEAASLAAANKRVSNILKKLDKKEFKKTNTTLFEFPAEHELAKQLAERTKIVDALYDKTDYEKALTELSALKEPIDQFFDSVMIMVDDEKKKQNRLALLASIRTLFTKVADISLLSS
ncbi:MAG: glycine--tRNA ligase subunit beta [Gammaproteobacteria bacterium RIFCSPHIGHO2_02_FULL_39_13]|nr:MAG: glycine--tRNA ligase subunit beta [Gammaproteobacteria bacterium RIFCSPHIGHO2_02_FULL_39_13]OGT48980.1 MAG: glycine--tRNA ligase subunit beta [Gammaproteobacteria bacterium RIFCSPHIGHO2_12_FULL_39_24]